MTGSDRRFAASAAGCVVALVVAMVAPSLEAQEPPAAQAKATTAPALSDAQRLTAVIVQQQRTIASLEQQVGELRAALARVEVSKAVETMATLERTYVQVLGGSYDAGDRLDWNAWAIVKAPPKGNVGGTP